MKKKLLALILLCSLLLSCLSACNETVGESSTTESWTEITQAALTSAPTLEATQGTTEPATTAPADPAPEAPTPSNASVYSGTPDTSWYEAGNPKKEYTLTSADQLVGLMELRISSSGAITFDGVTIKLDRDMVFNEGTAEEIYLRDPEYVNQWPQIHSNYAFKGTLDGQGHTISGIYMKLTTSAFKGIFGGVGGNAVLKNLVFENTCFVGPDIAKEAMGTLIAKIHDGGNVTISNVTVDSLMREANAKLIRIGGFVGRVETGGKVSIKDSEFKGNIDFPTWGDEIGGFVGGAMKNTTVELTNCTFTGSITGAKTCDPFIGYTHSDATVTKSGCTSTGKITKTGANVDRVEQNDINPTSLDTICAALSYAIGIDPPEHAAPANQTLVNYIDQMMNGEKVDRIFMYNPDAIGEWVYKQYASLMKDAKNNSDLEVPLCGVMPSVTPVSFGTLYTGAQPAVHGITYYHKPVIKIDTFFDALLRAGKKVAIIATPSSSIANIFLERDLDYCICNSVAECNEKAIELILKDEHDVIICYNGNYDSAMHSYGTESYQALAELRANAQMFAALSNLIEQTWTEHNTLVGFAMDHGCHDTTSGTGTHGSDLPSDLNITHLYKIYKASQEGQS